ncbi:MAG: porin family protein [Candidatus Kapabacteria bacterium]|nr:porin family protein [Candidatus Kapabacteria bacterium]
MDYQILIHDFVDGTLDKSQEESLFLALSSSEELRNELRQTIALEKAFGKKLSSFAPSAKSTVAIFSGLSMAIPGSASSAGVAASSKTIVFISKYIQAIFSSLATAVILTAVFLGVSSSNTDERISLPVNSLVNKNIDLANNDFNIPRIYSAEVPETIIKTVYKPIPQDNAKNIFATDDKLEILSNPIETEIPESLTFADSKVYHTTILSRNDFEFESKNLTLNPTNAPMFSNLDVKNYGLSLEFHGNQSILQQKAEVPESSNPLFSNAGITLLYNFNKNFSAGLDIRQEFIYQRFEGTDDEGNLYLYKQYPNYVSISAAFRYGFDINNWLGIYSQVMAGGTVTGGVLRSGVGLKFSPYPNYNLLLGVDGMVFGYKHQNNFYTTSKLGLNFGIGFNF